MSHVDSMSNLTVGSVVDTTIERIVAGGAGLAHAEGRTIFVALSAPGDRVRVRINRVRGRVCFGTVLEVLSPAPARVTPPCRYFGRCGGCDFQHLDYEAQLQAKVEIVRDCLRHIAGLDPSFPIPITPALNPWNYRSVAEWQLDQRGGVLGYFEHESHRICDVASCPVLVPALDHLLSEIRGRMENGTLPREIGELRAVAGDDSVGITPPLGDESGPALGSSVGGEQYHFAAANFFQINHMMLAPLLSEALRFADPALTGDGSVRPVAIDLYCGVGLFTLPLARRYRRVIGVEADTNAAGFATRNLAEAGLKNARIVSARVEDWLAAQARQLAPVAFTLLDPPRTGAAGTTVAGILALRPQRISYVSCDPATLARDLRTLLASGYTLDAIAALDLFPQTHHVEVVAHLARE